MNRDELLAAVLKALRYVAPDLEPGSIDVAQPLREQVEIDSMDVLNFVIGIHKATGIDIPETEYRRLRTIEELVGYLESKAAR